MQNSSLLLDWNQQGLSERTKMKVLKFNEFLLNFIGVCSPKLKQPTNEFLKTINSYLVLIGLIAAVPACATYCFNGVINDLDLSQYILALIPMVYYLSELGSVVGIGVNMKKVKRLHNELQDIIDSGIFFNLTNFTFFSYVIGGQMQQHSFCACHFSTFNLKICFSSFSQWNWCIGNLSKSREKVSFVYQMGSDFTVCSWLCYFNSTIAISFAHLHVEWKFRYINLVLFHEGSFYAIKVWYDFIVLFFQWR